MIMVSASTLRGNRVTLRLNQWLDIREDKLSTSPSEIGHVACAYRIALQLNEWHNEVWRQWFLQLLGVVSDMIICICPPGEYLETTSSELVGSSLRRSQNGQLWSPHNSKLFLRQVQCAPTLFSWLVYILVVTIAKIMRTASMETSFNDATPKIVWIIQTKIEKNLWSIVGTNKELEC